MRTLLMTVVIGLLFTLSVGAQPVYEWNWSYNHSGNGVDVTSDMQIDPSGDIVVTGYGYRNSTQWSSDIITYKIAPTGDTSWLRVFDGDSTDNAYAMDIDASGNIYVAGDIFDISDNRSYPLLIKYLPNGDMDWTYRRFSTFILKYYGRAYNVVVDDNGEAYITGVGWNNSSSDYDILTTKVRADGTMAWERYYNHDSDLPQQDIARNITYRDGFVYVAGYGKDSTVSSSFDIVVLKYDTNGTLAWQTEYIAARQYGEDGTRDIEVDEFGNVYLAGYVSAVTGNGFNHDYSLIKFDSTGTFDWDYIKDGGWGSYAEEATSVVIDSNNDIIVTGIIVQMSWADIHTAKFNSSGTILWSSDNYYNSGSMDFGIDVVVDQFNNVYVGGSSNHNFVINEKQMHLMRFDQSGTYQWEANYPGPTSESDGIKILALGIDNTIYGAGTFGFSAPNNYDMAVVKWTLPACCIDRGNVDYVIGPGGPVDVSDLTYLVAYLFKGGPEPLCIEAANVDGLTGPGGPIDVSDLTYLVAYLFKGGPPPPAC